MKHDFLSRCPQIILGATLIVGVANQAPAQTSAPASTVAPEPMQVIKIPVHNVDANGLAFQQKRDFKIFLLGPDKSNGSRGLKLPDGVFSISSAPDGKSLEAGGTAAGLQALKQQIAELDVPLRSVQVEAQIMSIRTADLDTLQIPFGATSPTNIGANAVVKAGFVPSFEPMNAGKNVQIGFARGNLTTKLSDLISKNKVKVFTAPRLEIPDGSTREIESCRTSFLRVKPTAADPTTLPLDDNSEVSKLQTEMGLSEFIETGFKATPIIKDGFIALNFQITFSNRITRMSAIFNDGETLVVQLPDANVAPGEVAIALVTARIMTPDADTQAK